MGVQAAWCMRADMLQAWCTAARDNTTLPPPWAAYEPSPLVVDEPSQWGGTAIYLLSLVPMVVLLAHRLFADSSSDLLPMHVATAVACVTPSLMIDPAIGTLASLSLNTILVLYIKQLKSDTDSTSRPRSPPTRATAPGRSGQRAAAPDAPSVLEAAGSPPRAAAVAQRMSPPGSPASMSFGASLQADAVLARSPPRGASSVAQDDAFRLPGPEVAEPRYATPPAASSSQATGGEVATGGVQITMPEWSERERMSLACGELVVKKGMVDGVPQGMASQRVHAPASAVWERILDFAMWPKMVDNVVSARIYAHDRHADGEHINVEVTVGMAMIRIRTFVHHIYDEERSLMTWTLDDEQESDLDANSGFWLVQQDPDDPGWSTVNYSIAVTLKSWAPSWLDSLIAVQGLPKAVGWVKRESEKRLKRRIQSAPDLTSLLDS